MSDEETKAAMRRPPHSGDGLTFSFDDTPGVRVALPAQFVGQWVQVKCISGSGRILFGDATVTVDRTQTSGAQYGYPMAAGDKEDWELRQVDTHLAGDAAATTVVELWLNSGKGR